MTVRLIALAIALAPLLVVVPALVMVARRWYITARRPYSTAVYEYRYAARTIALILAMDVGLLLFNVASVFVFGGSIIGNGLSTLVILLVARRQLRAYRKMTARAFEAENEEIAKLTIPDFPPDDL